ncbi:uncharacterized transporter C1039.04 [Aspergillus udagawae]|uniref:Uncharacterized transporter C1039.04 n=1 Tax=Aspergillus udagawae TaxID=91492 RepID=A0A8H3SFZ0_9EURO|nr:uncharacterized transporter C1039.04 [Aspergillus udagawae]
MDHIKEEADARHVDDVDITNMEKQPQQVQVAPSDQVHIRRMFDRRVLPIVCTLYILSYLDRGISASPL